MKKQQKFLSKVYKEISGYEFVSFDIFDTLIKRDVPEPRSVFGLVQKVYEKEYGIKLEGFKEKRIEAEANARRHSNGSEIKLDEIYSEFETFGYDKEQIEKIKAIEIDIEIRVSHQNFLAKEIYDYCISEGKKVIILSDMYLPQSVIVRILEKNGFCKYGKLYVSGEIGRRKSDGSLFRYALVDQKINPDKLAHIGDSFRSDFIMANRMGVKGIWLDNPTKSENSNALNTNYSEADRIIKAFISNRIVDDNRYYQFGYKVFGRLLFGFAKWLKTKIDIASIDNIFFFSRDGYILKRAFDSLYGDSVYKSHYFYASRRSLRLPYLYYYNDFESVVDSFPRKKIIRVSEFFECIGLDVGNYSDLLHQYNVSSDTTWNRRDLTQNHIALDIFNKIKKDLLIAAKDELDTFLEYVEQEGLSGTIAVVDIGWRGSLQFFLQKVLDNAKIPVSCYGYYVGLEGKPRCENRSEGFFNDKRNNEYITEDWTFYTALMESLFDSGEGSVKKYIREEEGRIVPLLYEYEYSEDSGNKAQGEKIAIIQRGALDFVRDIQHSEMVDLIDIGAKEAFSEINKAGNHPRLEHVELFSDFVFYDVMKEPLIANRDKYDYLIHPYNVFKDLMRSKWKIGYMKKAFRIPLPYYWIQKQIKKETKK